jgi:hypothetical protein
VAAAARDVQRGARQSNPLGLYTIGATVAVLLFAQRGEEAMALRHFRNGVSAVALAQIRTDLRAGQPGARLAQDVADGLEDRVIELRDSRHVRP